MKTARAAVILLIVLFFLAFRSGVGLLTDWWWYREIHNAAYFLKSLEFRALLFAVVFAMTAAPSVLTIYIARRLAPLRIRIMEGNVLEVPEHLIRPYLFPVLYGGALFVSFLTALGAASNWTLLLPLFARSAFGTADPVFHRDLGFYVFYLPILESLTQILFLSFLLAAVLAAVSYGIQKALQFGTQGLRMAPVVSVHLSVLLALLALTKALGYWIGRYGLLLTRHGSVFGIGYADFHARLPLLAALAGIAVFTALVLFLNVKLLNWKFPIACAAAWMLLSILYAVYPGLIQQFQVIPSELDKERPFLEKNIQLTRQAYGLDQVRDSRIKPVQTLTAADLETNQPTLGNIRLWDRNPLLASFSQLQEIRPYYTFQTVDVDRYRIQGNLSEIMISPRELDYARLQNPTWANDHLIFTHGYGFVASRVNEVTPEGLPDFFVRNIPPSGTPELHAGNPEIYYGEVSNDYVIANTRQLEFDYPSGDENKSTHYGGTGGVPLDSVFKKLAYAARFSSKIFFSNDIDAQSRILYHRAVLSRLENAFPLLLYDRDPYLVVTPRGLYWICDAYTVSDHYPYAQPVNFQGSSYNYIRNSAKIVVDAYNGTLTAYISNPADPVIRLYAKVFPGWFHPVSEMPESLRAHIRVPQDIFMVQAAVYALYHMTDPDVFYNREDLWQLPRLSGDQPIHPYYVIMRLPGSAKPEFLLMLPFTPHGKDNLAAWMGARCDADHYGQELVFQFPKESLVYGPSQIQARINQDPKFSELRTLWGQQGSRILLGHLQVIPVGNAVLYVQPLYIKAEHRELPELKLVLLAFGERIVMESTLPEALAVLFKGAAVSAVPAAGGKNSSLETFQSQISEALKHYNRALEYERNGDWNHYGMEIKKLGEVLQPFSKGRYLPSK